MPPTLLSLELASGMHCQRCSYDLRGLTEQRCPECGRPFDPLNPASFRDAPRASLRVRLLAAALCYGGAAVVLGLHYLLLTSLLAVMLGASDLRFNLFGSATSGTTRTGWFGPSTITFTPFGSWLFVLQSVLFAAICIFVATLLWRWMIGRPVDFADMRRRRRHLRPIGHVEPS